MWTQEMHDPDVNRALLAVEVSWNMQLRSPRRSYTETVSPAVYDHVRFVDGIWTGNWSGRHHVAYVETCFVAWSCATSRLGSGCVWASGRRVAAAYASGGRVTPV
jgi:hypothetical protein